MAYSKVKSKISCDKESPCFKHLETVKSLQVIWSVYTVLCGVFLRGINMEWPYLPPYSIRKGVWIREIF